MRISGWSSDVCSSDLRFAHAPRVATAGSRSSELPPRAKAASGPGRAMPKTARSPIRRSEAAFARSEEHTSELQSLMRISYAVFCLQKKIPHHLDRLCDTGNSHSNQYIHYSPHNMRSTQLKQ